MAYQPSPESMKALEIWEALAPLPQTANRLGCLKVLDNLHRIDGLTWDRINAICHHAAKEWTPKGFIASPAKLRQPTRSGEMKTWEAIERDAHKARDKHSGTPERPLDAIDELIAQVHAEQKKEFV